MAKNRLILLGVCLSVILLLSNAAFFTQCSEKKSDEGITVEQSDELAASVDKNMVDSNTRFGFNIFKKLILEDRDRNIFISPFSILLALAMAYNGAKGDTGPSMAAALQFEGFDSEELNSGFHDLILSIKNADSDVDMAIASSIWYKKNYRIKEDFIERNKKYFDSEVNEIDFSAPEAVDTINGWIEEATRGKIDKMLSSIPAEAVMYLINAIYFKGNWTYPFDENLTVDEDFYLIDGTTKKVPMMSLKENLSYCRDSSFSALKLPYGREKIAMYVILPDEGVNIDSLIESIDAEKWISIKESFYGSMVSVRMPAYKVEYGIKLLNNVLSDLGMEVALTPDADFSGIYPGIFISRVLHKAVIEVNEKGSEAAAATVVEMIESAAPVEEIMEFKVNRPFFFVIADERSGSILFMGKVVEPAQ